MSNELIERPKPTLFQITQTLAEMFDMLETAEPEDRDAINSEIDRVVSCELATKVDGIVRFDRDTDCEVASLQALASDIERKIGVLNGRKRQVREMTARAMSGLGTKQLKGDIYTISMRAGSESVEVMDKAAIPDQYKTANITMPAAVWSQIRDYAVGFHETEDGPEPETIEHVLSGPPVFLVKKTAIREAVKRGETVPGAGMIRGEESLQIR